MIQTANLHKEALSSISLKAGNYYFSMGNEGFADHSYMDML